MIKDREKNHLLSDARSSRNWTQQELADKIGCTPLQINRWEQGKARPSPYFRQQLARVFGRTQEKLGLTSPEGPAPSELLEIPPDAHLTASVQHLPAPLDIHPSALHPASTKNTHARWYQPKWTVVVVLSLLLVAAVSAGGLMYLHSQASPSLVGHLSYLSSGQISDSSNAGITDGVQLAISPLPRPSAGMSDYVWLLPDPNQSENPVFLLGTLAKDGALSYSDAVHTNLLSATSRLLITEQSSAVTPLAPSVDQSDWRFRGSIPDQPAQGQTYGFLDHLRHLLALDPTLHAHELPGGLVPWLYRSTQAVYAQALQARDGQAAGTTSPAVIRQEVIALLYYLDGTSFVSFDLPSSLPPFTPPDARLSSIGLLQLQANQDPPGYLYHVALHLTGLSLSPGATPTLKTKVTELIYALNAVNASLSQIRQDAKQLVAMTDDQLLQSPVLFNDMVTNANNALIGKDTAQGVEWIMTSAESLATIEITAYRP